jgi:biotin synthase
MALIYVSAGTAAVLGLVELPMAVAPTTAYLMVGGRCAMDCAFCAQARSSTASDLSLSRVNWPQFPMDEVCARLSHVERLPLPSGCSHPVLQRCCLQVTAGHGYLKRALDVIACLKRSTALPLSVAVLPRSLPQIDEFFARGVDRIGFGLDAASERVFRRVKGTHWSSMLALIEQATSRHPGRVAVHLIVGLGETEREVVERIEWVHSIGAAVSLFSFTPVRGTALARREPPPLAVYRRMQAARWLIVDGGISLDELAFDADGGLAGLGSLSTGVSNCDALPVNGAAFCTSGCTGCNRPFYNERPGGPMYNYPRPLEADERLQALSEMAILGGMADHAVDDSLRDAPR